MITETEQNKKSELEEVVYRLFEWEPTRRTLLKKSLDVSGSVLLAFFLGGLIPGKSHATDERLYDLQYGAFLNREGAETRFRDITELFPDEEIYLIKDNNYHKIIKDLDVDRIAVAVREIEERQRFEDFFGKYETDKISRIPSYDLSKVRVIKQHTPNKQAKPLETMPLKEGFYIQVGSFGNINNARWTQKKLSKLQIEDSILFETIVHGESYNRVLSGPYKTEKEAINAAKKIFEGKENGIYWQDTLAIIKPKIMPGRIQRLDWRIQLENENISLIPRKKLEKIVGKKKEIKHKKITETKINIYKLIEKLTRKYNGVRECSVKIDSDLIRALIYQESKYKQFAVGHKVVFNERWGKHVYEKDKYGNLIPTAYGYTQLSLLTAKELKINLKNIFDPETNIYGGIGYLGRLIEQVGKNDKGKFKKNLSKEDKYKIALAYYNHGRTNVLNLIGKSGIYDFEELEKKLPKETQIYVSKVITEYNSLKESESPHKKHKRFVKK